MKFTKELRQEILDAHAAKHDGRFDPDVFLDEVRKTNGTHAAWSWWNWDAFHVHERYLRDRAAEFARGLRITVKIETHDFSGLNVKLAQAPSFISPLNERANGGGYKKFDPEIDMDELGRQAAQALASWLHRYQAVLVSRGIDVAIFDKAIAALEPVIAEAAE